MPDRSPDELSALSLAVSPRGALFFRQEGGAENTSSPLAQEVATAFASSTARGLLHLATRLLDGELPPSLVLGRDLARHRVRNGRLGLVLGAIAATAIKKNQILDQNTATSSPPARRP